MAPVATSAASTTSSTSKSVSVFYFGGWSASIRDRLIASKPEYVILDLSTWPRIPPSDITLCKNAGITLCAYIPTGGMRGYIWNELDTTDKTPAGLDRLINQAVNIGLNGVFFDEGGLYTPVAGRTWQDAFLDRTLVAPGSGAGVSSPPILSVIGNPKYNATTAEAWKGLTAEYYINHAKEHNMFVIVGCPDEYVRPSRINSNIFPIVNAVLTSEEYNTRAPGLAPVGQEKFFTNQCFVLSYSGSYDASSTNSAINYGFGAAYCSISLQQLPSPAFENYMAAITEVVPPTTTTPPPTTTTPPTTGMTYSLNVSIQGQGTISNYGTVLPQGSNQIPANATVNLVATPAPGYVFRTWTWPSNWLNNPGYSGWRDNPTSWTMVKSTSIVAVFDRVEAPQTQQYTVNISTLGSGTTSPQGVRTALAGSTMTVTAVPASGFTFAGWTGSITSANQTIDFVVNSNINLQATFSALVKPPEEVYYNLVIGTKGLGKVSLNGKVITAGTYQIPKGQSVTLIAIPEPGYRFRTWTWPSNWLKNPKYAGWKENPTSWIMTEPSSIIAVFEKTS
ncbi:InlB B-repeat-containing protein [Dehalogenimonas etheniformans]|uniref:InlB B-repeat-containing protein n=1 Tax=Dehalogenimonas etheniformans TaxID=1536648 RepID=UPI00167F74AE|nr:hypothetical protein [Dehalogenimonas etheniformans]QNT76158.1 hypothetical protein HX448_05360 [Dehalogenimonas etheniformans]